MYIFSVEEAQKDLPRILEMVAEGKDVAIGGDRPALLLGVRAVGNLSDGDPESCGSMVIGRVDDESVLEDELVKPLPDDIIAAFYKPRIYDAAPVPESR
ncbi:hypothetical protein AWB76_07699 [Caballeronia temeraria]|uniref:Uncharacterized protein n=1 Tax=Caballeronia temeraria TaxID=1777137 RepID=A0A158DXI7_9BURK|nr:hypothetical protein [Caballeronia temeraria]SAK99335.1 hypothetical protein AWB76_07699 [Caballeronia temeraria]